MRPTRLVCLLTLFFFAFAVFAPVPLAAAENARRSPLGAVKDFLIADWAETRNDMRKLGDFLARDFARTKADFKAVRTRLASLKVAASAKGTRLHDRLQKLRENLTDRLGATIDEMGVQKFRATIEKFAGARAMAWADGMDERMVRARMARSFDEAFGLVVEEMERSGPAGVVEAVQEADGVVDQMARGASPEQVVETLRTRHFGADGGKARGPGFFKALITVLKTLFMVAACGAISLVSLGILSYGLAASGIFFVVAGGAGVVACLYGVIFYIAECIKAFRQGKPLFVPEFALEVAR